MKIHTAEADLFAVPPIEKFSHTDFLGKKKQSCCHFAECIATLFPFKCQQANCEVKSFDNKRKMHTDTHTFHFLSPSALF